MKNFSIQSLTLTAMVMMVYGATIRPPHQTHNDNQKKLIHDQANKMLKEGLWNNTTDRVPKPSDGEKTCVKNFLCLAEKSLETVQNKTEKEENMTYLIGLLHQYNEKHKTHCNLTSNTFYHVVRLLEEISRCALPTYKHT